MPLSESGREPQTLVEKFFDTHASYWREVYDERGLRGLVYARRMDTALRWVEDLHLGEAAPVLEVGCGAGLLGIGLAERRLRVTCTDSSARMVALAREQAMQRAPALPVTILEADARRLPFDEASFALVIALGLLPWLPDPDDAVAEMARVLAPGGWLIVTADNRARLNFLSEPRESPLLTPLRPGWQAIKRKRSDAAAAGASSYLHLPHEVDQMLRRAHLEPVRRTTVGFGPFTFLGREVLADALGRRLHARLEQAATRSEALRRTGWHYLVAAQK